MGQVRDTKLASSPMVESGRQALTLLARNLKAEGYNRVVFPTHHCASMIEPFLAHDWEMIWAEVSQDWTLIPPPEPLSAPARTLIYSISLFGVPESYEWLTWVEEQHGRGSRVLSDETHRVGGEWLTLADHHVASLRKLLPVPDGAVLTGIAGLDSQVQPSGTQGAARWEAMKAKSRQMSSAEPRTYLELFGLAEEITEHDVEPAEVSRRTRRLLASMDIAGMMSRRRANAQALTAALQKSTFRVTTNDSQVPSHVVLEHPRADALRAHLVSRSIYAPVHWLQGPVQVPSGWRGNLLSIPVDHRYSTDIMLHVAAVIGQWEREEF